MVLPPLVERHGTGRDLVLPGLPPRTVGVTALSSPMGNVIIYDAFVLGQGSMSDAQ